MLPYEYGMPPDPQESSLRYSGGTWGYEALKARKAGFLVW